MAISLTAGMRSNLINLQSTAKLMEQTAVRLNTGKKVNSALDDPISYFTAKGHMSRAADLGTLKNGMSEGIQTITAANNSIESIIGLISAAKAKAESAKSADTGTTSDAIMLTLSTVTAGDVVTIGGTGYTATAASAIPLVANQFEVGTGTFKNEITAMNLAVQVNSVSETDGDIAATVKGGSLLLASAGSTDLTVDTTLTGAVQFVASDSFSETLVAGGDPVASLVSQYATLMSQIDQLQNDAGYKGINLLNTTDTLTVSFEGTNKLEVNGFNGTVAGLGVNARAGGTAVGVDGDWTTAGNIDADIALLDKAVKKLEAEASSLASSLSIVTTRQEFTANMMNTLSTGADNLTLADMNEEGANMLMLQTQQALGTSALSMAAQTAQAVLRLF